MRIVFVSTNLYRVYCYSCTSSLCEQTKFSDFFFTLYIRRLKLTNCKKEYNIYLYKKSWKQKKDTELVSFHKIYIFFSLRRFLLLNDRRSIHHHLHPSRHHCLHHQQLRRCLHPFRRHHLHHQ